MQKTGGWGFQILLWLSTLVCAAVGLVAGALAAAFGLFGIATAIQFITGNGEVADALMWTVFWAAPVVASLGAGAFGNFGYQFVKRRLSAKSGKETGA